MQLRHKDKSTLDLVKMYNMLKMVDMLLTNLQLYIKIKKIKKHKRNIPINIYLKYLSIYVNVNI